MLQFRVIIHNVNVVKLLFLDLRFVEGDKKLRKVWKGLMGKGTSGGPNTGRLNLCKKLSEK